jgi:hypothetical protein
MEKSHNPVGLCCVCPFCIGELDICSECHGAFITPIPKKMCPSSAFVEKVEEEDEDEDEVDEYAEEEFRGSPIDFRHEISDCSVGGCDYCVGTKMDNGETPKRTVPIFQDDDED